MSEKYIQLIFTFKLKKDGKSLDARKHKPFYLMDEFQREKYRSGNRGSDRMTFVTNGQFSERLMLNVFEQLVYEFNPLCLQWNAIDTVDFVDRKGVTHYWSREMYERMTKWRIEQHCEWLSEENYLKFYFKNKMQELLV